MKDKANDATARRVADYRARHAKLAEQLRDGLLAIRKINDALRQNFLAAETEFPSVIKRGGGLPEYPVAAGLLDFSWSELRIPADPTLNSRFRHWLQVVETFLHPSEVRAPTARTRVSHLPVSEGRYDPISAARLRADGGRY